MLVVIGEGGGKLWGCRLGRGGAEGRGESRSAMSDRPVQCRAACFEDMQMELIQPNFGAARSCPLSSDRNRQTSGATSERSTES